VSRSVLAGPDAVRLQRLLQRGRDVQPGDRDVLDRLIACYDGAVRPSRALGTALLLGLGACAQILGVGQPGLGDDDDVAGADGGIEPDGSEATDAGGD